MTGSISAYAQTVENYFEKGLTDGLPVVPPYPEAVEKMIAASGRPSEEVLGKVPPSYSPLTIETVAVNAVMAGCLPEYMPVIVAALEAMLDPKYNWVWPACSLKGVAPLIIVNGPIRHQLGINCKGNLFGPGFRANATIGRAIRLIILNVGGSKPQQLDKSTFGHPGKYSYVIGEDEEGSPWSPFHVEHGFMPEESIVTVAACDSLKQISNFSPHAGAEGILLTIVDAMSILNNFSITGPSEAFLIISPEHRQTLVEAGYDKEKIREFIIERCGRTAGEIRRVGKGKEDYIWFEDDVSDDTWIPMFKAKEDIKIISAGGDAGRFTVVIDGRVSPVHSQVVMKKIKV